jgi:hypothetical protein
MCFEFSQDAWEDALIYAFKGNHSMAVAFLHAAKIKHTTVADWKKLEACAAKRTPKWRSTHIAKQQARAWLAGNAVAANTALWDTDYVLAKKLLRKKNDVTVQSNTKVFSELRKGDQEMKGVSRLKLRELDKMSDWRTVK